MRKFMFCVAILLMPLSMVEAVETGFLNRSLTYDGEERLYQVYVPANYSENENISIVFWLRKEKFCIRVNEQQ